MRRRSVVVLAVGLAFAVSSAPAVAAVPDPPPAAGSASADPVIAAGAGGDFFNTQGVQANNGVASVSTGPVGATEFVASHPVTAHVCLGGDQTCGEAVLCDDGSVMTMSWLAYADGTQSPVAFSCPQEAVVQQPQVTPGLVLRALRRIPLPASELVVQPPGGRTLVNFDTNFYTERGELSRVVRLLGRRVELRIWPERFTWHYGDGVSEQTANAGAPYPDLEITHRYLSKGRVAVSVDTTYAADFRVGAGAWRPVAGTVTIPGAAEGLRVVTARPVLVGG